MRALAILCGLIVVATPFACSKSSSGGAPPSYAISVDQSVVTMYPSSLRVLSVTVTSVGGFVSDVALSALNLPTGVTATFSPAIVLGAQGTSVLTLASNGSPTLGTVNVTVRGTSGATTKDVMVELTLSTPPSQRFTLSANPTQVQGAAGGGTQATIAMQSIGGFSGNVALSVLAPNGITGVLNPMTLGSTTTLSTLSLAFDLGLAAGTYQVTVNGTSGSLADSVAIPVTTTVAPTANGITVVAPPYASALPAGATAVRVGLDRAFGVIGNVTLAVANLPSGVQALFAQNPCPIDGTRLSLNVAGSVAPGLYAITINATNGANSGSAGLVLRVGSVSQPLDAWVSRIEVGQTLFGNTVRLVPDKSALVRVHALADRLGVTSPVVRLTAMQGTTTLGTVGLTGPATMPTAEQQSNLSVSYRTTLPAAWVQPGLSLLAEIDPSNALTEQDETNNTATLVPTVSNDTTLPLTIVPIDLDSRTGTPPNLTTEVMERWPFKTLNQTIRAAYAVTSVPRVEAGGTGWTETLAEIRQLRANDQSNDFYYGVIDVNYGSGVAGIGYIGFPASVGRDDDIETAVHELGHNFGLRHADCGGAGGPDVNYPYPGALAGTWGYAPSDGQLRPPTVYLDAMGYCAPEWISDYHYNKVHQFFAPGFAPRRLESPAQSVLFVQGVIRNGEVELRPVLRTVGRPSVDPRVDLNAAHWLTVEGERGTRSVPFAPDDIGCLPASADERHFSVLVPDVGPVRTMRIDRGNRRLLDRVESAAIIAPRATPATVVETGDRIVVRWNAAAYPRATITHVGERRTTLALWRTGGEAVLRARDLPANGSFEVQLSRGLRTEVVTIPRR